MTESWIIHVNTMGRTRAMYYSPVLMTTHSLEEAFQFSNKYEACIKCTELRNSWFDMFEVVTLEQALIESILES